MEEQKKGYMEWVKAHKKELIIAGISATALTGIILCIKNRDSIEAVWKSLNRAIEKTPAEVTKASQTTVEKIAQSSGTVTDVLNPTEIPVINKRSTFQNPFEVCDHMRNLPNGWHASAEKIATAAEHGYNIQKGQTWVNTYTKGVSAA